MGSEMLLNRQEFIDRVNRWATAHQAPAVTDRMLQDWNEEGVFPAGIPISGELGIPLRFYNWRHYFHALLICRLKKLGQERYSQLRVALWFRGIEIPGDIRSDLATEFSRAIRALTRHLKSSYVPTLNGDENPNRAGRLLKQLGEQAPIFKATILELSDQQILAGYTEGRYGMAQQILRDHENYVLGQIAVELGLEPGAIPEAISPPGLMGDPTEGDNPGILLIQNSTDEELNIGRAIFHAFMALPDSVGLLEAAGMGGKLESTRELTAPIPALKNSIRVIPAWRLFLLVIFLAHEKRERDPGKLFGNMELFNNINVLWQNT